MNCAHRSRPLLPLASSDPSPCSGFTCARGPQSLELRGPRPRCAAPENARYCACLGGMLERQLIGDAQRTQGQLRLHAQGAQPQNARYCACGGGILERQIIGNTKQRRRRHRSFSSSSDSSSSVCGWNIKLSTRVTINVTMTSTIKNASLLAATQA